VSRARAGIVCAALIFLGCASQSGSLPALPDVGAAGPSPIGAATLRVVASFYPLYEFAGRIGGDLVEVRNLVPAGAEPHDFEPAPQDVAALHAARLLVYNGAGFEPWVNKLLAILPPGVERVNATEGVTLIKHEQTSQGHTEGGAGPRAGPPGVDPHVWLDPVLAQQQVDNILAGFARIDPQRMATYAANAARLKVDLQALHDRYAGTLRPCRIKTLVTTHAAFGYLARRYGLSMIPISGLSPESEPSPARMRAVVQQVRRYGIRVIYFETLVNPKVAETIAREAGARTLVLNPVEGLRTEEQDRGATYFTVMDENLRNLAEGLDCR
jgi:zinc transport system substrate-binding protein